MSLLARLRTQITADGPISIADYMSACLLDPAYGYYATRDPFGAKGDFTTAPEISQMFGELIGLALAQCWMDHGSPRPFTLAELGPGRGTLMADILRATAKIPGFTPAVILVEASETLRGIQSQTLKAHTITWQQGLTHLPQQPLFLVANEFFDALPIRQFQRDGTGWRERRVGLGTSGGLQLGLGQRQAQPALHHRLDDTRDGDVVELCPAAPPMMQRIGQHIASQGGAGLIIDYGSWRSKGDTLQAMTAHRYTDPLAAPGQADLTAHVDFEALAQAASPACATKLTAQGVFLKRLGITARAQSLAASMSGEALKAHIAAHHRLTHPDEMGNLFKVLGLYAPGATPPPGCDL